MLGSACIAQMFVIVMTGLAIGFTPLDDKKPPVSANSNDATPAEIFEQRIMPIFRSPQPSSCIQCHLSSVDLKQYVLPSHEKTFLSLRDQGLIDLEQPRHSKILKLIEMGNQDPDEGARRIHAEMRKAEYEAFASWIEASCRDPELRDLPPLTESERARPERPDAVIRHARKSRVVDSFVRNIWSQRMRCFPCHTPHEIQPRQKAALKKQQDFDDEYGEAMRIFYATPEETIDHLIKQSKQTEPGRLPMLNLDDPSQSLLVVKPTSKVPRKDASGNFEPPSFSGQVTHMGGLKMHRDDQSYKSFLAWIDDYANVTGDRYTSVKDLPSDNWHPTKRVIRIKQAPENWEVGTPVQLFVHAWDTETETWSEEAVAFTQGTVTPRRMVNGALFLLSPTDPHLAARWDRAKVLVPQQKYLVKAYVDFHNRLANDPALLLGNDAFWGQAELKRPRWRVGFPKSEMLTGEQFQKR